jgi:hypothetical protein
MWLVLPLLVFGIARLTNDDNGDDDDAMSKRPSTMNIMDGGNYNGQSRYWQF